MSGLTAEQRAERLAEIRKRVAASVAFDGWSPKLACADGTIESRHDVVMDAVYLLAEIDRLTAERDAARETVDRFPKDDQGVPLRPLTKYYGHKRGRVFSGYMTLVQAEPVEVPGPQTHWALVGLFSTKEAAEADARAALAASGTAGGG